MNRKKIVILSVVIFIALLVVCCFKLSRKDLGYKADDQPSKVTSSGIDIYATTPEEEMISINRFEVKNDEFLDYFDFDDSRMYNVVENAAYTVGSDIDEGYYIVNCSLSSNAIIIGNAESQYNRKYTISGEGDDFDIVNGEIIELKDGENVIGIADKCLLNKVVLKEGTDISKFYNDVSVNAIR